MARAQLHTSPSPGRSKERMSGFAISIAGSVLLGACVPARHIPVATENPLPTEFDLSLRPSLVRDWGERVLADEPNAGAGEVLVQGGQRSLPLLRRFLES